MTGTKDQLEFTKIRVTAAVTAREVEQVEIFVQVHNPISSPISDNVADFNPRRKYSFKTSKELFPTLVDIRCESDLSIYLYLCWITKL